MDAETPHVGQAQNVQAVGHVLASGMASAVMCFGQLRRGHRWRVGVR